ncbi:hypothetical protein [Rhodospirillum centenum]|uniref:Uncharacterized protein n=1 Tax=Rhodospirillum centenum (strain ATCC 51521 / SW) TaxID=414684 RepID=B6IMJ0_RHOCS|nr:hypothetical protein [Rhodospirillum centenum]ACI98569.1 hypothetical protein RC1_1153 [Rhodospirillum centenum SW]
MAIRTQEEYERAVQEFQGLRDAPADSQDGRRRAELDAEIKAFYMQNGDEMRRGRPTR